MRGRDLLVPSVAALGALVASVALAPPLTEPLWYDELQRVTFAARPLLEIPGVVRAYDAHPPGYYLGLHVWQVFGRSDLWLRLGSVASLMMAVAAVVFGSRVHASRCPVRAATVALGACLTPLALAFSTEVRMYAPMMAATAMGWASARGLAHADVGKSQRMWTAVAVLSVVWLVASHALGFVAGAAVCCAVVVEAWSTGALRQRRGPIAVLVAAWLVATIPWLLVPHAPLEHAGPFQANAFGRDMLLLVVGFGRLPLWGVVLAALGATALPWFSAPGRRLMLACVVLPLIALAVGAQLRPIWHWRAMLFAVPLWGAACGLGVASIGAWARDRIGRRRALVVPLVALSGWLSIAVAQRTHIEREASVATFMDVLRADGSSGDAVLIPNARLYWGWAWYAGTPADPRDEAAGYTPAAEGLPQAGVGVEHMQPVGAGGTVWAITTEADRAAARFAGDHRWEAHRRAGPLTLWRELR